MKTQLLTFLLFATAAGAATDTTQLAAAKALYAERKYAEAEAAFKKLVASELTNADLHYHLGSSLARRGDTDAAIKSLEKAVALAPKNGLYHHDLGNQYGTAAQKAGLLSKFGLAKKCVGEYEQAVALEPANVAFHQSLFEFYRQAPAIAGGGADKAEAEAAAILKLDPVRGHGAYATLYAANKEFDKVVPHLTELKKLDPVRGRMSFASLYVERKEYDKAFAELEEVLKTSPDDYAALYQFGRIAAVSGQHLDRGLVALRRCLELTPGKDQPTHAAAHWRIGNLLENKNDSAGARAAYQAALKADPNFTQATESLKKLK